MKIIFKSKTWNVLLSMPFAILLLLSCSTDESTKDKNELDKLPKSSSEVIAVKTIPIQKQQTKTTLKSTGLITTENEAAYAFKIGGIIDKIYVKEGAYFKRGQLLASLKLTEISSGVAQNKLSVEKAKRDYERVQNLYRDSVATLEQLQNTKTALDVAQKQLDAISFNQQYAKIYAQNSGFVTKKLANEGEIISGGNPVFIINENASQNWILKVGLSDQEWATISIGDSAEIVLDAFPNQTIDAKVFRKSLAADRQAGSFEAELKIVPPKKTELAVGMYGEASIYLPEKKNLTVIPYEALVEADGEIGFVFAPKGKNQVQKVNVQIDGFDSEEVRIRSGLENVSEIIVSNSAFLNENSTIQIQN